MRSLRETGLSFTLDGRGLWDILASQNHPENIVHELRAAFRINAVGGFPQQHLPASIVRRLVGVTVWNECFSFAVVRNPWELVVSSYHYQRKLAGEGGGGDSETAEVIARCPTFSHYAMLYPAIRSDMSTLIADDRGDLLVDRVLRFERLDEEFRSLCAQRGIRATLVHENGSDHGWYREYYTPSTQARIERHFARDIERFQYLF